MRGTIEIGCYTDLPRLEGDPVTSGPYTVLSPLSVREDWWLKSLEQPHLGLVLRVDQYLASDPDDYLDLSWEQDDADVYHGGSAWEELAALLSLLLGVRLRAGGILRVFHPSDEDQRGYPHEMDPPYLPRPATRPMLPGITHYRGSVDFTAISLLDAYPRLSAKQARALVRSARSYQEAIWIADNDPRQAWLRLVTAVEAVAQLQSDRPAITRLRAMEPEMADRVARCGDKELLEWVTKQFADQAKSTDKFLSFLKKYQPPPPARRPRGGDRQNWNNLQEQLRHIYRVRSLDLHQGIPVPREMCRPPYVSQSGIAEEVSFLVAGGKRPLCLHVFAYIVRRAVQSWWSSIAQAPNNG